MSKADFFKKHWISAVVLPIGGMALAGTVATNNIITDIATDITSDIPSYPGFGGNIIHSIGQSTTPPKVLMAELEPYSPDYLNTFYSNVMNPQDLTSAAIYSGNMHPMSTTFNNHIVAHFEAKDYDIDTGFWPENDNRTAPLKNNGFNIHINEPPAQKVTVGSNTFLSCNGGYDSITGTISSIGAEEGAAIIFVTKAGTRSNSSGTQNNLAISLDSSSTAYSSSNPAKFRLIENTSSFGSRYRGYIGYMNGDGNSATTRITTDGIVGNGVEVHVMYVATGADAISAYLINGKPVNIDAKTKTSTIPLQSDKLSICGSPDDLGVASDIQIAEILILKDNGNTPLPYSLLTQAALSMASRYDVTNRITGSFTYNTNHANITSNEISACGAGPFNGSASCLTQGITQNTLGENAISVQFVSPVVSVGKTWITYNDKSTSQLPINRDLSASIANQNFGYVNSIKFLGETSLILDNLLPYNPTTSVWQSQASTSKELTAQLALTSTSEEPLNTIKNPIDGSNALHCNGKGALSGYVAGGVTLTDGMTILISGQLNNVNSGSTGPRGLFNIGEFGGTSASNRGLVELRHTLDGYLWESSLGGTTEKILVGDKPFHIAIQFNEKALGGWTRDITIVTENGIDRRSDLNTNLDRVANDDTIYICDDGRGQNGQVDINNVVVFNKLYGHPFTNNNQIIHKTLEAVNGNHPIAGSPIHEPNLKEQSNLISFLKTLVP